MKNAYGHILRCTSCTHLTLNTQVAATEFPALLKQVSHLQWQHQTTWKKVKKVLSMNQILCFNHGTVTILCCSFLFDLTKHVDTTKQGFAEHSLLGE